MTRPSATAQQKIGTIRLLNTRSININRPGMESSFLQIALLVKPAYFAAMQFEKKTNAGGFFRLEPIWRKLSSEADEFHFGGVVYCESLFRLAFPLTGLLT
jgi:hypothetical protein